eukprot:15366987-Ditylum_brightwellii.AAC.1
MSRVHWEWSYKPSDITRYVMTGHLDVSPQGAQRRAIRTLWSMRMLSNPYQSLQYGVRRAICTHRVSWRTRLARHLKLREGQKAGLSRSSSMGTVA